MTVRKSHTTALFFLVAMFISFSGKVQGQSSQTPNKPKEKTVNIIDIPKQATEAIMDVREINDRLIKEKELKALRHETDSLVKEMDTQLNGMKQKEMPSWDLRKIEASLIQLQQQKSLLKTKRNELQAILDNLAKNKKILTDNLTNWKEVRTYIRKKKAGKTVEKSATDVIATLNKAIFSVNSLTAITLGITRKLSALELDIDSHILLVNKIRNKKNREILQAKQPSLFALNYKDREQWNLSKAFGRLYNNDLKNLGQYLAEHTNLVIIHLLLIIALMILFVKLSKTTIPIQDLYSAPYKRRLKELLARPVSAALIMGIFAAIIIYPNHPLILTDLTVLLILAPATILLRSVVKQQFRPYIYALAVVLAIITLNGYLPSGNIWSRYSLLVIGLIEFVALLLLAVRLKKEKTVKYRWLFNILIFTALFFSLAGIFSNVFGKVLLSKYLLFSIASIIFVIFLVLISLVMINGITVTFITSRLGEKSHYIRKNKKDLIKNTTRITNFIALIILLHFIFGILKWETAILDSVTAWLNHQYNIGTLVFSWGRLFVFVFIIWFTIVLARIIRDVLEEDILNQVKMEEGLPHTIAMTVRYALISIGVLLAFGALGIPVSDLAIMFSALGVGIGFGLQNIFNNLVSGFILLFERPIKIGDTIEVGDLVGTVRSIGIRASNIRTFDGAEIIVPNGNLISNEVVNWTLSDQRRRIEIKVNVAYDSDPVKVKEVLLRLLENHEDVAKDPKPGIYFIEMGNSALVFRILFWTHQYGKWYSIRSNMMYAVFQALKEADIEIPYDQLDLHIRSTDAEGAHPKEYADPEKSG